MRMRTTTSASAGLGVALLALSGCSFSPDDYWSEEQQSEDVLPAFVQYDELDPSASRLLAEGSEGFEFYVSRKPDPDSICLLVVDTRSEDWTAGCAGSPPLRVTAHGVTAVLDPLSVETLGEDFRELSDGLFVDDAAP